MAEEFGIKIDNLEEVTSIVERIKNYKYSYIFEKEEIGNEYIDKDYRWLANKLPHNIIYLERWDENTLGVMAFGGVIGWIKLDKNTELKGEEKDKINAYIEYVSPEKEGEIYFKNGHGHIKYFPEQFKKIYVENAEKNIRERIKEIIEEKNINKLYESDNDTIPYLDIMSCAAYVRYLRTKKNSGGKYNDFGERGIQNFTASYNIASFNSNGKYEKLEILDDAYKNQNHNAISNSPDVNMLVIDLEYIASNSAKVDFALLDLKKKSFGLVEFKYQCESMEPNTDDNLTDHFKDFVELIRGRQDEVVDDLLTHTRRLLKIGFIEDKDGRVNAALEEIEKKRNEKSKDLLWCGFYFRDDMNAKLGDMTMKEKVVGACKEQILEVDEFKDILECDNKEDRIEIRYQQSDLDDWELLMEDDFYDLKNS